MSIQATVVLDSGIVLLDAAKTSPYMSINVGYFQPRIVIYSDGEMIYEHEPQVGKKMDVRLVGGNTAQDYIPFSLCMTNLLRLSKLYNGSPLPRLRSDSFETIIGFNSGLFRSSGVKERYFYEMRGEEKVGRKSFGKIAHDIVVEYDMGDDGDLTLSDGGALNWSSRQFARPTRRLDVEILADDSTAKRFFAEALELDPKGIYFLPNQGHPPPCGAP